MAYTTTASGMKIPDPNTVQAFETAQVNANLLTLEALSLDSTWSLIPMEAGFTSEAEPYYIRVRKIGKRVFTRGLITGIGKLSANTMSIVAIVPIGFRPDHPIFTAISGPGMGGQQALFDLETDGRLQITPGSDVQSWYSIEGLGWFVD